MSEASLFQPKQAMSISLNTKICCPKAQSKGFYVDNMEIMYFESQLKRNREYYKSCFTHRPWQISMQSSGLIRWEVTESERWLNTVTYWGLTQTSLSWTLSSGLARFHISDLVAEKKQNLSHVDRRIRQINSCFYNKLKITLAEVFPD